ncbi:MAG: proline-rich domain-containing protein [bacterium]
MKRIILMAFGLLLAAMPVIAQTNDLRQPPMSEMPRLMAEAQWKRDYNRHLGYSNDVVREVDSMPERKWTVKYGAWAANVPEGQRNTALLSVPGKVDTSMECLDFPGPKRGIAPGPGEKWFTLNKGDQFNYSFVRGGKWVSGYGTSANPYIVKDYDRYTMVVTWKDGNKSWDYTHVWDDMSRHGYCGNESNGQPSKGTPSPPCECKCKTRTVTKYKTKVKYKTKIKYKEKIVERWHQPKTVVQERQTFLIVGGGTTVIERETPAPPVQLGTPGRAHGHDFTVTAGSQSGYISLPSRIDIRQSQTQNQHQHQGGHHRKPPTPGNPGQPTGPDEPPNYPIPGDPGGPVTGPGDNPVQVPFN